MKAILALDPASVTGFAHSNGQRGIWRLGEMDGFRQKNLLAFILDSAKAWGCDLIAYEEASFGSHNPNVQAFHNELRGIIKLAAAELQIPTIGYHIGTIKVFATGNGKAPKEQIVRACKTMLGFTPEDDNVADAAFILEMAKQGYRPKSATRAKPVRSASKRKGQSQLF